MVQESAGVLRTRVSCCVCWAGCSGTRSKISCRTSTARFTRCSACPPSASRLSHWSVSPLSSLLSPHIFFISLLCLLYCSLLILQGFEETFKLQMRADMHETTANSSPSSNSCIVVSFVRFNYVVRVLISYGFYSLLRFHRSHYTTQRRPRLRERTVRMRQLRVMARTRTSRWRTTSSTTRSRTA